MKFHIQALRNAVLNVLPFGINFVLFMATLELTDGSMLWSIVKIVLFMSLFVTSAMLLHRWAVDESDETTEQ